jgi:hypothetical protein
MKAIIAAILAIFVMSLVAAPAQAHWGTPEERQVQFNRAKSRAQNDCGRALDWACRTNPVKYIRGKLGNPHLLIYVFAYGEDDLVELFEWRRCSTRVVIQHTGSTGNNWAYLRSHKRCNGRQTGSYPYDD